MRGLTRRVGAFIRNLNECISAAAKDTDTHYYIPKSRFTGNGRKEKECGPSGRPMKFKARNVFLGSFRDCVLRAWHDSDDFYYIPKRRFADDQYNRAAYRSEGPEGVLSRIIQFPGVVISCVSMAWKATDTLYYLPKNRYREREFVTKLMGQVPKPPGKLFIRPFSVEFGLTGYESAGEGWTVGLPTSRPVGKLVVPEDVDQDAKPELEM